MCDICDTAIQEICGYKLSCWKIVGTFFLVLITAGLILVLITWRKDIKVQCTWCTWYTRSHLLLSFLFQYTLLYREAKLVDAEKVLLTDHHHHQVHEESVIRWVEKKLCEICRIRCLANMELCSRLQSELFFVNKKNKYVWDETVQLFRKLRNIDEGLNQSDFFKMQVSRNRK